MGRKGKEDPWSFHDDAVLYAAVVVGAVLDGAAQYLQPCPTPFPPQIEGERALAQGGFTLYTLRAQGDGTYVHQSGMMLATGRGALPLMAGVAAVQAIGNSSRRARARAETVPRWVPDDGGLLYVSTHGFYLQTGTGLHAWTWSAVQAAQMVGPARVCIQGSGQHGPVSWIIEAEWAELLFVLWALTRHPRHPQLHGGSWTPPGWFDRYQRSGRQLDQPVPRREAVGRALGYQAGPSV